MPHPIPLKRVIIYALGFLLPPLILGLLLLFTTAQRLLIPKRPAPLAEYSVPARAKPTKPVALIALGRGGTQLSDLLVSAETLGSSGALEIWTAAPTRELLPTTGAVAIVPDATYVDAPKAEILVIPALLAELDPPLLDWIRARAAEAKVVLALSDGVQAVARAGLLDQKEATGHPLSLRALQQNFPKTSWSGGTTFVAHGKVITSPGIASTMDASLAALEIFGGASAAQKSAQALGVAYDGKPQAITPATQPGARELLMLFIRGGFFWGDPRLAVELKPGGHEIELAALLDVFPRTWTAEMLTVAPKREPVLTKHQLALVPTDTHDSASLAQATPQQLPQVATESSNALSQPFPQALRAIIEGSDDRASATELVAYLQGMLALPAEARVVREDSVQKPWLPSWRLWVRFVVLGVFGMMLTILIERRFRLE